MLKAMVKSLKRGCVTQKEIAPNLPDEAIGLPYIEAKEPCQCDECKNLQVICPTGAITTRDSAQDRAQEMKEGDTDTNITDPKADEKPSNKYSTIELDLGKCIACGLCIETCPNSIIKRDARTRTARFNRDDLILSNKKNEATAADTEALSSNRGTPPFKNSVAVRVVSTGCSACDLEVNAAFNPIFDLERFGVQLVASPRMADILVVTGPCPKGMHEALLRTWQAMPEPKRVIAVGSCAISGTVHAGGYAEANGAGKILPVDVDLFIPGCPPHPWSIVQGILSVMGR